MSGTHQIQGRFEHTSSVLSWPSRGLSLTQIIAGYTILQNRLWKACLDIFPFPAVDCCVSGLLGLKRPVELSEYCVILFISDIIDPKTVRVLQALDSHFSR